MRLLQLVEAEVHKLGELALVVIQVGGEQVQLLAQLGKLRLRVASFAPCGRLPLGPCTWLCATAVCVVGVLLLRLRLWLPRRLLRCCTGY